MENQRDEFTPRTRNRICLRAGNRCSNPDCRRLTSKPNPTNPDLYINLGVAAHITAASKGGPRYDPERTREERRAVENGIWLCTHCGRMVDDADTTYTEDTLLQWKRDAEQKAARDASSLSNEIELLLTEMEEVADDILEFTHRRRMEDDTMYILPNKENFQELSDKMTRYSQESRDQYLRHFYKRVSIIVRSCEGILSQDNDALSNIKMWMEAASTNLLGMERMAQLIYSLNFCDPPSPSIPPSAP